LLLERKISVALELHLALMRLIDAAGEGKKSSLHIYTTSMGFDMYCGKGEA